MNNPPLFLERFDSERLFSLFLMAVSLVIIPWMATDIASENYKRMSILALVWLQMFMAARHWRFSVYVFIVYVMLEGFFINYFYGQPEMNLVKDGQMALLFCFLVITTVVRGYSPFPNPAWLYVFFGFALIYVASAFNPALPSILVGLIGVRVTLLFFVCFGIGYWFFRDRKDVTAFLRFQTWLSMALAIFGIVQYFTGPSLLLAISPGFQRAVFYAYVHGQSSADLYFRTISTFASTGGFSQYLWVSLLLTLGWLFVAANRRDRWVAGIAIALQLAATLTTGGRTPAVLLFVSMTLGYAMMRQLAKGITAMVAVLALTILGMFFFGTGVTTRFATILDVEGSKERNIPLVDSLSDAMKAPIEGLGAGRYTTAAKRLNIELDAEWRENQLARIRFESGLAGFLLFVVAFCMMLADAVRCALRLKDPRLRLVGCLVSGYFVTSVLIFPVGLPLDVPPANFYFWFLLGLLYALVRMEASGAQGPATQGEPRSAVPEFSIAAR